MKNGKPWLRTVTALLLLSTMSFAAEKTTAEIPFKLSQDYLIVVQGSIGGLAKLNFLIDTGAIPSMVDLKIARKLGLVVGERQLVAFGQKVPVKNAVLPNLRLGPVWVQSMPVAVGDLSFLVGTRIDAIIGLDVLKLSSFEIDYESKRISFEPVEPSETASTFKAIWPFLIVQLKVRDQPVRLLVDTGSRDLILFLSRVKSRLPNMLILGEKILYHSSGTSRLRKVHLPTVSLSHTKWEYLTAFMLDASTEAYPSEVDGVLGVLSLGIKRIRFDFERNALSWER